MANLPNLAAPKNSGLALLADVADELDGTYHYPVKRRGLPRALLPNREAIAWLEADEAATEIEAESEDTGTGLVYTFAYGRVAKTFARPMFQVLDDVAFSGFRCVTATACPCGDFSRTAYCPDHEELEYDWDRRSWIRPGTEAWYRHHAEDRPAPARQPDGQPVVYVDTGARPPNAPPAGLYDRMIEMFGQPLPQNQPYRRATNVWLSHVPASDSNPENRPSTSEHVHDIDEWVNRVLDLQGATILVEGFFGEGSFTFETGADRDNA